MASVVKIEKVGNRIHAEIPYDNGAGPIVAKLVTGARWSKAAKRWTYPLDPGVCRDLRSQWGDRLRVGEALADWYRSEVQAEQMQLDLRSAVDASLERTPKVAPVLYKAMCNRPYQKVGARFIADGRNVLIADEPGTGKTLEALSALVEAEARWVLVFAKKKAIETVWVPEAERWLGNLVKTHPIVGSLKERRASLAEFKQDQKAERGATRMHIVICNIEMVRWTKGAKPKFPELFEQPWDAIVVDESHKALIGKHTMSDSITQTRYGMMKLKSHGETIRVALSGSPYRGHRYNIWGTLNWLRPDLFTSFWRFAERFFEVDDNGYGKTIGEVRPEMEDEYHRALAPVMLRRTKAEVAPDMPPRLYGGSPLDPYDPGSTVGVWLEMEPQQARMYKSMVNEAILKYEGGEIPVNGILPIMTRSKQLAVCAWDITGLTEDGKPIMVPVKSSAKYEWLKEFAEDRLDGTQKVVVASQFTKVVNAFSAWLEEDGIPNYVLTGETSDRDAKERVNKFNDPADPVKVFLINTMAGGESINLDTCADDIVFLDETYIPDDQEQVENRIHRMSRIHQVTVWYLRSKSTIEEKICRITGAREAILKGSLDGSRGITFQRLLRGD